MNQHIRFKGSIIRTLALMLVLMLAACENDIQVVNSITSATEKQLPLDSEKDVEMLYSDSAVVRARLTAPVLDHYAGKKNYTEMPKGMLVIFYDAQKKEQNRLKADYGIGYDNTGNGMDKMEAKRHVVVVNEKGDKLETEHLTWDATTKQIYTDEFVKITTKDKTIWGTGLKANQDFSEYEIKNPQGELQVDDKDLNNDQTGQKGEQKTE
ncbi:MAG: hypothetical protein JWP12_1987 [Bacteroidetes bacterium]|nr:hypothetical protein [Bacteroidota bacterium]